MKAKYIGKYYGKGFDRNMVYLEYEYRGHTYTVYENRAKGSEPLAWQHRNEQAKIDESIEAESRPKGNAESWEVGFNAFWEYVEGDNQ